MKRFPTVIVVSLAMLLLRGGADASPKTGSVEPPAKQPSIAEAAQQESAAISGKVVETMESGGYSYVLLEKNGKKTWVAVPQMKIKVGQEMSFRPGANMGPFTSKTLNRTFENIIFSAGPVQPAGAGASNPTQVPRGGAAAAASTPSEKIKVEKAAGPDAYTVSEIHAKSAALNEKTAVVRGKVVKVSEGIMGKNWVHLQDGTGEAASGSNKLVVTTKDLPAVGDIVTMKGTIYKDKDFGSGYRYAVIMEKANIQR